MQKSKGFDNSNIIFILKSNDLINLIYIKEFFFVDYKFLKFIIFIIEILKKAYL